MLALLLILAACRADSEFLVLSDIHYDPMYLPNATAKTFCRKGTETEDPRDGTYGRYGCDSPANLVTEMLKAARQTVPNPDFVLILGDFPAHDVEDPEKHTEIIVDAVALVAREFEGLEIVPVIGNNDPYPDYYMPADEHNEQLQLLADAFSPFFDRLDGSCRETFAIGGYYEYSGGSVTILVINTDIYSDKWTKLAAKRRWVSDDVLSQWAWLEGRLEFHKALGGKVIIAGHIPPGINGYNSKPGWTEEATARFFALAHEYSDVIAATIFGHFHQDELKAVRAQDAELIFGMTVPSFSLSNHNNPGFLRVACRQGSIVDYTSYYADVQRANRTGAFEVQKLYTFSEAYGSKISSSSIGDIITRMHTDAAFFSMVHANQVLMYDSDRATYACGAVITDQQTFDACVDNLY